MRRIKMSATNLFLCLAFAASSHAAIDPGAESVALKMSCTDNGNALDNCFTDIPSLTTWIEGTRKPGRVNPLRVDIGPGNFMGTLILSCDGASGYEGYVSFMGSGSSQSIIEGPSNYTTPIFVQDCTELEFSDLKTTSQYYGGVAWSGGGISRWTNVEIDGAARAWYEPQCGAEQGQHYWFSSKLTAHAGFTIAETYNAACDESWFFGSEITSNTPAGVSGNGGAITARDGGIIHLYGSFLRSIRNGGGSAPAATVGATPGWQSATGGEIHIHGTGIDVVSDTGEEVVALRASGNGLIHADVSAYVLKSSGNKVRIDNNGGVVKAPYNWAQDNQPPEIGSETGADMAVETGCDPDSCHDVDTGTETHLLIYNDNCNVAEHGPWFDVVTGRCRGDMTAN